MSEADSDSRMTTIIDAATGDQWRVPTRAVEAIRSSGIGRPGLDVEALEAVLPDALADADPAGSVRDDWAHSHYVARLAAALVAYLTEDRP